ncbi:phage resistance protein [Dactylosporangium sp. NBC_01737]|uniref:phage resistance protein n=1 Tax=Dactylosporangium sp. NBC_01737 TaxID=2975959 RepID=UPI002E15D120|nr:phage resistance protein [Dactylosporangium sp. NBC_01737]
MTLLRDVIKIPERVTDSDFVMRLSEGVSRAEETLREYVVTDNLRDDFVSALGLVGQAVETGRSQAAFLHGSFGAGKSHFMVVLHELLRGNPDARAIAELAGPVADADRWLKGRKVLPLTFHLLGARSLEEAVFSGYRRQIVELEPSAPPPAVHRSDTLLVNATEYRADVGDERFFARLNGASGGGSAGWGNYRGGWDAARYAAAAVQPPGTPDRDRLVSDLTATVFTGAVHSGEYLDIDEGLAVVTQHAKSLGYDVIVLFLDELILWLSQHLSNLEFVNQEGGKLAKFVESADKHRAVPIVSFVARQRDLVEFLGPHVPGAERQAFSDVFRHGRGRFAEIVLPDRNLPLIAERRLLRPIGDGKRIIDEAFAAVQRRRDVWDTLVAGNQYGDAGVGSDAAVFRRLYPFSPALVATLVSLSQALQRERTALKVMARLLVAGRDRLRVNDVIGVAELFDELVAKGELPDNPQLKKHFETARTLYRRLRPLVLTYSKQTEATVGALPASHQVHADDKLVKTLLLAALVPDVPALTNLTAARLNALNYGSMVSPIIGSEPPMVLQRLRELAVHIPEIQIGEGTDPVIRLELSEVDYTVLIERVPTTEDTPGARRRLIRELVCAELGITAPDGMFAAQQQPREWRGRRHHVDVVFANIRDANELPEAEATAVGGRWRIVVDYPFDDEIHTRRSDTARIRSIGGHLDSQTLFWLPYFLTDDRLGLVGTLVKLNYLLAGGGDDRLYTLASDFSPAERAQAKAMLEQQLRATRVRVVDCLKQAYGVVRAQPADVVDDPDPVLQTIARGFTPAKPIGGTLRAAFDHLTGQMLAWVYPGTPNLPEDEALVPVVLLRKILEYVQRAVADPARRVTIEQADRRNVRRVVNPLRLGECTDEGIYTVNPTYLWWSAHFLKEAKAAEGASDRFPVTLLRRLTDLPQPRGLDRVVQHLLIAVFALDQDLSWYRDETKIQSPGLDNITDDMELRIDRRPDGAKWKAALATVNGLTPLRPASRLSAANLARFGATVREYARQAAPDVRELVKGLESHADQLGIDPAAPVSRLATAKRVAALLDEIVNEHDDVVLVEVLADPDLGDVDAVTASKYLVEGKTQTEELVRTSWHLLSTVAGLQDARAEEARVLLDKLADSARREQLHADLADALRTAVREATDLLARALPPPPPLPPVVTPPVVTPPAVDPPVVDPPVVPPLVRTGGEADVSDDASFDKAVASLRRFRDEHPGRRIRLEWSVE